MSQASRRVFMLQVVAAGSALGTLQARAQATLDEKDPQAVALGYVNDSAKADAKKYPKHSKDQRCSNCQVYQGKPTDAAGPCAIFGGKLVAGPGWCSAWVKKA